MATFIGSSPEAKREMKDNGYIHISDVLQLAEEFYHRGYRECVLGGNKTPKDALRASITNLAMRDEKMG